MLRRITPICVASTPVTECDFANPMEYRSGVCFEADTMFRYSFKILPGRLKLIRLYMLVGLSGKISVSSSELELAIL